MTVATYILAAIFGLCGVTALAAGVTGARWFFSASGSRAFTGRRHRLAARVLYAVAGALMILAALYLIAGSPA